jgi:hypothetical protein
MNSISIWPWLTLIIFGLSLAPPVARILGRLGYSKWWTIVYFIPFVNIIGLWILAYARWPAVGRAS